MTDRESGAAGHNRVFGPDFQVRFKGTETIIGQYLVSDTDSITSGAAQLNWSHNTEHFDLGMT
jgi:hypothetical protein